ncbi:tetratricopeptide repeat protein [Nostoc sp. FACHB-152]|uniref:tetratricopeptide repeat protein n=1 Tax=unclassified Nostoc TaxID=2593658 RepID=UPI001682FBE9|nr:MULTISPECIES: tetratricopeptide repeat protein [unclassified Nostoc]MBD2447736.1 tetratricopeptide repeat protein [Nostoc sp. FACHB-152]MBD2467027.1 tetratricopeptide repeat protein [Nostoc sp. FACHB-145]
MSSSGDDYIISRQKKIERKKKILTVVGLVSFLGSTVFGLANLAQQKQQPQTSNASNVSLESTLQKQAQGYELVLKREPNNQVALEKLSVARLHLKDTKGAIELMEKLVKLHPERKDYKVVLEQVKQQQDKSDR